MSHFLEFEKPIAALEARMRGDGAALACEQDEGQEEQRRVDVVVRAQAPLVAVHDGHGALGDDAV